MDRPPAPPLERRVYKIALNALWEAARRGGVFAGSEDDARDGFIHLSTGKQLAGTIARHFRNRTDLVLIAYEAAALGEALRWESSRGGQLFPHLYAPLPMNLALWEQPLQSPPDGKPILEEP